VWQFFRPVPGVVVALLLCLGLAQATAQPNVNQQNAARIDALEDQLDQACLGRAAEQALRKTIQWAFAAPAGSP
jgi:hypothetical protein